jgi:adenine deaminase
MKPLIILITSLLIVGCSDDSFEILGISMGELNTFSVKEGPREPQAFRQHLRQFYELDYPNAEFSFAGIAVIPKARLTDEGIEEGTEIKEDVIWES